MKRQKYACLVLILMMALCAGCGAKFPEMSKEQEDQIVEYAANAIMRHINDYDSRLVDLSLYSTPPQETEPENKEEDETGKMDAVADTDTVDVSEEVSPKTLEEVLLPAGVTAVYAGCHLTDSYPEEEGGEPYFALDASDGKQFLVLEFIVCNTTGEAVEMDIFSGAPRCNVLLNNTERVRTMSTMLLNDLSTYIGTLSGGEEISLVLVAEIDGGITGVENLELHVSTDIGEAALVLQ